MGVVYGGVFAKVWMFLVSLLNTRLGGESSEILA